MEMYSPSNVFCFICVCVLNISMEIFNVFMFKTFEKTFLKMFENTF